MRADQVEISWDAAKAKWLVRIQAGDEVIHRYCEARHDVDEQTLRAAAGQVVTDEGYEPDLTSMSVRR
jgi:hypothetical protein